MIRLFAYYMLNFRMNAALRVAYIRRFYLIIS